MQLSLGTSVSAMLANQLHVIVEREAACERAKAKALARLDSPFGLECTKITNREALES